MTVSLTWRPLAEQVFHDYDERADLLSTVFAYPRLRKEPLVSASHVIRQLARLESLRDATGDDRELAIANILRAEAYYGLHMLEAYWDQIGRRSRSAADK